jgi:hypothetical protein
MEQHIDRHEVIKESVEAMAISTTKQFRKIILGGDTEDGSSSSEASKRARKQRKTYSEMELKHANTELAKIRKELSTELKEFHAKTTRMEEEREQLKAERDKYKDLVSAHGIRSFKRSEEQVEEKDGIS